MEGVRVFTEGDVAVVDLDSVEKPATNGTPRPVSKASLETWLERAEMRRDVADAKRRARVLAKIKVVQQLASRLGTEELALLIRIEDFFLRNGFVGFHWERWLTRTATNHQKEEV